MNLRKNLNIRPLNDSLLVQIDEDEWHCNDPNIKRILESGILQIPEINPFKKKSNRGKVLRIGSNVKSDLKVGDYVIFRLPSIFIDSLENDKIRLIKEHTILCVEDGS